MSRLGVCASGRTGLVLVPCLNKYINSIVSSYSALICRFLETVVCISLSTMFIKRKFCFSNIEYDYYTGPIDLDYNLEMTASSSTFR